MARTNRARPGCSRRACWARESVREPPYAASRTCFESRRSESSPDAQPKKSSAEEFFRLVEEVGVERSHRADGFRQENANDLGAAQGDHPAELLAKRQARRVNAQTRAQHAVVGAGRAAALQVTERDDARLDAGPLFDQV